MQSHVPVLIVGAGPVGLALAGDLAWRGVPSLLVERTDGAITQPKMDLIGPRTMEFCRRWGLEAEVRQCPYNPDQPQDNVYLESFTGHEFGRDAFPTPRVAEAPPQSPVRRERCPQDMFDPILRRWVESMPRAQLRYGVEMTDFTAGEGAVSVELRAADGSVETVSADYLIGCDGGASQVRQHLDVAMHGTPALTYTTNAIFRCKDFWSLHDKPAGYRFIFIGPEGAWATIVAIDGWDRFRFSIIGDENRRTLSEDEVRAQIIRAMGKPFDFEILSILPWVRRELVADSYGRGRVFIAGDAAHLNSPTGAFGMNTGMQDAVDLGWKLAGVLQGWGGEALLASYEPERRPVALRNVREASDNLRRMLFKPPAVAFEATPGGAAARKGFGEAYTEKMRHEWHTLHIHLGYVYEQSPIVCPDGTPPPEDPPMTYIQTARPGSRAPHVWLVPGRSTLDLFGRGFVLLRLDPDVATDGFTAAAELRGLPFEVADIGSPETLALYKAALVLVRPDGFVAWRGDAPPQDALAVIDRVRGAAADAAPLPPS